MYTYKLYDAEYKFVNLVWEVDLMDLSELVWTCFVRFGWKKSITMTALRKLCERGILRVEDSVITAMVSKENVERYASESLPKKLFKRPRRRFFSSFLNNSRIRNLLNYRKRAFWILLTLVVSTLVCVIFLVGYANRPMTEKELQASRYAATEEERNEIRNQIDDLIFPDNLTADKRRVSWTANQMSSIDFIFEISDASQSQNAFEVIRDDLDSFDESASKIYSRIDGLYSVNFIIDGDEYSGRVVYSKSFDTSDMTRYKLYAYIAMNDNHYNVNEKISDDYDVDTYSIDF